MGMGEWEYSSMGMGELEYSSMGMGVIQPFPLSTQNPNVSEFMSTVLDIHNKFNTIVKEVFGGHKLFYSALDRVGTTSPPLPSYSH